MFCEKKKPSENDGLAAVDELEAGDRRGNVVDVHEPRDGRELRARRPVGSVDAHVHDARVRDLHRGAPVEPRRERERDPSFGGGTSVVGAVVDVVIVLHLPAVGNDRGREREVDGPLARILLRVQDLGDVPGPVGKDDARLDDAQERPVRHVLPRRMEPPAVRSRLRIERERDDKKEFLERRPQLWVRDGLDPVLPKGADSPGEGATPDAGFLQAVDQCFQGVSFRALAFIVRPSILQPTSCRCR